MRESAKTFEDLLVWQKAHLFVLSVYRLSAVFPKHEIYGLTSQFRRAAVSIAANIAEGFRKNSKADKLRFYNIARGSVEECRYYLILSKDLEYTDISEAKLILEEVILFPIRNITKNFSQKGICSTFFLKFILYF